MKLSFRVKDRQSIDFAEAEMLKSQNSIYGAIAHENELARGLPLGSVITSAVKLTDSAYHLLDGSSIPQNGIYADFATYLKSLYPNGDYSADQYKADYDTYGQCGHFVIDDINNVIKLPMVTDFIANVKANKPLGFTENDMLKQHTHKTTVHTHWNAGGDMGTNSNNTRTTYNVDLTTKNMDPAGGDETRPKNVRFHYYIVLVNKLNPTNNAAISGQLNLENYVNEVASKLAKSDIVRYPICTWRASDGLSWYVIYNDGWKECGGCISVTSTYVSTRTITYPITFSSTNYTLLLAPRGVKSTDSFAAGFTEKTTTGFTYQGVQVATVANNGTDWEAKGF